MTVPDVLAVIATGSGPTIVEALRREYPNGLHHVMHDADDRPTPRAVHPAFYGCFDWHSAVEMHWALAVLLRRLPGLDVAAQARAVLDEHLTAANLQAEAGYLRANPGFERPYGWGWLLTLAAELADWADAGDADAARWSAALAPVAATVEAGFLAWLPVPAYPDRSGMHSNSAFALARALPWARRRDGALLAAIETAARRWYGDDEGYSAAFEPGGSDFLSPALTEIVLMREVLDPDEFVEWFELFSEEGVPTNLSLPAVVTDDDDGQGAHLHGLNLYRIHALRILRDDASGTDLEYIDAAIRRHTAPAAAALTAKGWMSEHWLAAYGVLAFG